MGDVEDLPWATFMAVAADLRRARPPQPDGLEAIYYSALDLAVRLKAELIARAGPPAPGGGDPAQPVLVAPVAPLCGRVGSAAAPTAPPAPRRRLHQWDKSEAETKGQAERVRKCQRCELEEYRTHDGPQHGIFFVYRRRGALVACRRDGHPGVPPCVPGA